MKQKNITEIFLTEPGKAKTVTIKIEDAKKLRRTLNPGDEVQLRPARVPGQKNLKVIAPNGQVIGHLEEEVAQEIKPHLPTIKAYYVMSKHKSLRLLLKSSQSIFAEDEISKISPYMGPDLLDEEELELEPEED